MNHPELILVPWAVFAVALALKVLKFGKALKRHLIAPTPRSLLRIEQLSSSPQTTLNLPRSQ